MKRIFSKPISLIFATVLLIGLAAAVLLSQQQQNTKSQADSNQVLSFVDLYYQTDYMEKSELPHYMSAQAYDTNGIPIFEDVFYSWGISSPVSLGKLVETNQNISGFQPLNVGSGDIYVTAIKGSNQVTKSFKMRVVDSFTASPPPGGSYTAISFNLLLHGRGRSGDNANPSAIGNLTPKHQSVPFTVGFYDNADTHITDTNGVLNYDSAGGKYTGYIFTPNHLPTGLYSLKVKTPTYLRKQLPGFYLIEPYRTYTTNSMSLVAGDAFEDNKLNILDYNRIFGCYEDIAPATDCDPTRKALSDLNDDGNVNHVDFNLFLREISVQEGQ